MPFIPSLDEFCFEKTANFMLGYVWKSLTSRISIGYSSFSERNRRCSEYIKQTNLPLDVTDKREVQSQLQVC